MNRYKTAIIGAGSIGAMKPDKYDSPTTQNILTHAHAVYNHAQTYLVAVVDTDMKKALAASAKWKKGDGIVRAYWGIYSIVAILDALRIDKPDIVVVATPTNTHYDVLENMLCGPIHDMPKLVIAEKPFCDNYQQAEKIAELYREAGIPLLINYTRRFDPAHREVKHWIETGALGKIHHCRLIYTRGLKREACHAIDLFNWWFGPCKRGSILEYGDDRPRDTILCDYSAEDPSYTAHLKYENGTRAFLTPVDGRDYSVFEIDILGSKGRVTFVSHGLIRVHYKMVPEPIYGDYDTLEYIPASRIGNMGQALLCTLSNAVNHLDTGEPLLCTVEDALAVHRVYDMLRIKTIEEEG